MRLNLTILQRMSRKILRFYPATWQHYILTKLFDFSFQTEPTRITSKPSTYVTVQCCRQIGKSETIAAGVALMMIVIPSFSVILAAPTLEQARIIGGKVKKWLGKFGKEIFQTKQSDKVVLLNNSSFKVKSLKPDVELEGETAHLLKFSEDQTY